MYSIDIIYIVLVYTRLTHLYIIIFMFTFIMLPCMLYHAIVIDDCKNPKDLPQIPISL